MKRRKPKVPLAIEQAAMLIDLAREKGVRHLKVGEFECTLEPEPGEPHDAVGFGIDPTVDTIDTEDRARK